MFTNELKNSRFIPWLLSLVVAAEVVRAGDGDDFQLGTETQIGVQSQPIMLSRLIRNGKVFEFRRDSTGSFDIICASGENRQILFSWPGWMFYDIPRPLVDHARVVDIADQDGEFSALIKVGQRYFLLRLSEKMPIMGEELVYLRSERYRNYWNVRYIVRFSNIENSLVDFDFDPEIWLPKLGNVVLSGLDTVRAEIPVKGKEESETREFSIVPAKGFPKFDEGGGVLLLKDGIATSTHVRGWSPIIEEAELVRKYSASSLSHVRNLVGENREEFERAISAMKDKKKLAVIMKRVDDAFAEIEAKPEGKALGPDSGDR